MNFNLQDKPEESKVDPGETQVDLDETQVNPDKAEVDPDETQVDPDQISNDVQANPDVRKDTVDGVESEKPKKSKVQIH